MAKLGENDPSPVTETEEPDMPEAIRSLLFQREQISWKKGLKKGIIHTDSTCTEVITNQRGLGFDDKLRSIVKAYPLRTVFEW